MLAITILIFFPLPELWRVPCLCYLNAHENQINVISSEIVHCQSLSKLILDCNNLSFLPMQVTKLPNLEYLSFVGNKLHSLPNGVHVNAAGHAK